MTSAPNQWIFPTVRFKYWYSYLPMPRKPASRDAKSFGVAFGAAVRARRDKKRWTAQELAEATGLSVDGVRRIEVGKVADPGIQTVDRIATALATTVDALVKAARKGES